MINEPNKPEMDADALIQATEVIIRAYGKAIETSPVTPGCVADVRTLPYSKAKIKSALALALKLTKDRSIRKHLKAGYLRLADYQENVGPNYKVIDGGADPSAADRAGSGSTTTSCWVSIVREEKQRLRRELRDMDV